MVILPAQRRATPGLSAAIPLEKLEQGEIITIARCPLPLPEGNDRQFLLTQQESGWPHKTISYNPSTGKVQGFVYQSADQEKRLRQLLADFGSQTASWLGQLLPRYAANWRRDRVCFRVDEEATRQARLTARNDLLHLDAFPSRPTQGYRILRLCVNLHPTDSRVWATSETFAPLLERFQGQIRLPQADGEGWRRRLKQRIGRFFQPGLGQRTVFDQFMLRFHHFLKANEDFQERSPRRIWHFPPGSLWLSFTDGISHANLRGSFLLEQTFFVAPSALVLPEEAPAAVLEQACGQPVLRMAA